MKITVPARDGKPALVRCGDPRAGVELLETLRSMPTASPPRWQYAPRLHEESVPEGDSGHSLFWARRSMG